MALWEIHMWEARDINDVEARGYTGNPSSYRGKDDGSFKERAINDASTPGSHQLLLTAYQSLAESVEVMNRPDTGAVAGTSPRAKHPHFLWSCPSTSSVDTGSKARCDSPEQSPCGSPTYGPSSKRQQQQQRAGHSPCGYAPAHNPFQVHFLDAPETRELCHDSSEFSCGPYHHHASGVHPSTSHSTCTSGLSDMTKSFSSSFTSMSASTASFSGRHPSCSSSMSSGSSGHCGLGPGDQPWILPSHANTQVLSDYEFGRQLGIGTFGVTRLVRDRTSACPAACKSICKTTVAGNATLMADIRREVAIMEHLSGHPSVVGLRGVYEDNRQVHLVMDLCTGGDLHDFISKAPGVKLREADAAAVAKSMLEALAFCHARGVIHRDVKPENFLLEKPGQVQGATRLSDFGVSAWYQPGEMQKELVGTPYYMAPEVFHRCYGPEADVWSAGVVLYLMLTGRLPFSGQSDRQVLRGVLYSEPDYSSKAWSGVSPAAQAVVRAMLVKDPRQRASISSLLELPWFQEHDLGVLTRCNSTDSTCSSSSTSGARLASQLSFESRRAPGTSGWAPSSGVNGALGLRRISCSSSGGSSSSAVAAGGCALGGVACAPGDTTNGLRLVGSSSLVRPTVVVTTAGSGTTSRAAPGWGGWEDSPRAGRYGKDPYGGNEEVAGLAALLGLAPPRGGY